jgi:dolichol-phosphate mannosyltransferase
VKLSVVIPAHNEEGSVAETVTGVVASLRASGIEYEIIVVDDTSDDDTVAAVQTIARRDGNVRCVASHYPRGFGHAVRSGLDVFTGDAVAIVMADGSDDPADLVRYHALLEEGYDCAFGSRFMRGSMVVGYPRLKLVINRVVNVGIRVLFRTGFNDTTNAFKAYRREVIETVSPLLSNHFNLTVEIPLKALVRGHSFGVIPISWRNRSSGRSKLSLREMGSRYLFIVLYVFLEAHLSCGDYRRNGASTTSRRGRGLRGANEHGVGTDPASERIAVR